MRAVSVTSFLIALAGVGISLGQPQPRAYAAMGADFTSGVEVGKAKGSVVIPVPGTLASLHWETNTAGTGAGTFTLAAEVDGVVVCSTERACTATGSENVECGAPVAVGEDVHALISASTCDTLPLGVASLWLLLAR